ncbi:MAG: hypothetical protein ACXADB_10960 [Candidatus Hermodarchaeia archaeon]
MAKYSIRNFLAVILIIIGSGITWFSASPVVMSLISQFTGVLPGLDWILGVLIGAIVIGLGAYIGRRRL